MLDENERIFTELLRSIERRYIEVRELVRAQEKTTVIQAEGLLDRLEEEITLLKKKHTDLEKLSHTDDHIHFLQVGIMYSYSLTLPDFIVLYSLGYWNWHRNVMKLEYQTSLQALNVYWAKVD